MKNHKLSAAISSGTAVVLILALAICIFALPKVLKSINENIQAKKYETVLHKLTNSCELMMQRELIGPYHSTQDFVEQLSEFMKFKNVCYPPSRNDASDGSYIEKCFNGETKIHLGDDSVFDIKDARLGEIFDLPHDDNNDFSGPTVAITTVDNAGILFAYNKRCDLLPPGVYEWKNGTNKTTECFAALIDADINNKSNVAGKDIFFLHFDNFKTKRDETTKVSF